MSQEREHIVFVTGKLAAPSLKEIVSRVAAKAGFDYEVFVAKISVAALMTPQWLAGKLFVSASCSRVILPGWCVGDLSELQASLEGIPIELGPKDLHDLPVFFDQERQPPATSDYDVEILAEINHADRLPAAELFEQADRLQKDGADVIDLGCSPGSQWDNVGHITRELVQRGFRVSIDSFDLREVRSAVANGAELVLSVNSTNRQAATHWDAEVVVIPDRPDQPDWLDNVRRTIDVLETDGVRYRIDPVIEPIGFGFARSLKRFWTVRDALPNASMMMGIGNLTELTEVDSAGINAVLVGMCQEIGVTSVLTTQVINWARSAVREIAVARTLMKYAVDNKTLPKHVDDRLVMLRDPRRTSSSLAELRRLQRSLKDKNFRLYAVDDQLIAFNGDLFEQHDDAFGLFSKLNVDDPSHAFYLGWELMKATLAVQLGKNYTQDESLRFGMLTREEPKRRRRDQQSPEQDQ